jgi:acetyltransferase-like isoleucine patch superfamily enzyme
MPFRRSRLKSFSKPRLISLIPSLRLRIFLMRRVLGYEIDPTARIGYGTFIQVSRFTAGPGTKIGRYNHFKGPMSVTIQAGARIDGRNVFHCGTWYSRAYQPQKFARRLVIGREAVITSEHRFDCIGAITIGERSVVAGLGSQFWTHGAGSTGEKTVKIGDDCYVGSAVRVAPGSEVGDDNVVAMGAVLAGDFSNVTRSLIGGVPAKVIAPLEKGWRHRSDLTEVEAE